MKRLMESVLVRLSFLMLLVLDMTACAPSRPPPAIQTKASLLSLEQSATEDSLLEVSEKRNDRKPKNELETELMYWRILCSGKPQNEKMNDDWITLECLNEGWLVQARLIDGKVRKVSE